MAVLSHLFIFYCYKRLYLYTCTLLDKLLKKDFFFHLAVTYIDKMVGEVLDSVVENGLSENTIISLIGDHGWTLGENQVRYNFL